MRKNEPVRLKKQILSCFGMRECSALLVKICSLLGCAEDSNSNNPSRRQGVFENNVYAVH